MDVPEILPLIHKELADLNTSMDRIAFAIETIAQSHDPSFRNSRVLQNSMRRTRLKSETFEPSENS